ncbi:MAG: hypothetical protein P4L82_07465 [Ancalomicrobiaceae bacterium]|nr:hypothetical protein [Ancalomicrobiaceae bacterium]
MQDFLFTNGPAFSAATASQFLSSLKLVAKTTDKVEWAKLALSSLARGAESVLETVGSQSPTLMVLGGYRPTNPAGDRYFSQTPFRFGDYVAKFSLVPSSANLLAMHDVKLDLSGGPDGIRTAMNDAFAEAGGSWELKAQLLMDVETMPVEDSSVPWPENQSPYITIARIDVLPQPAWNDGRSAAVDDEMAFSPWNGLAAHQPLGSINRVRQSSTRSHHQ